MKTILVDDMLLDLQLFELNLGPCSCGKETDPRLAVLAKLLENRENE